MRLDPHLHLAQGHHAPSSVRKERIASRPAKNFRWYPDVSFHDTDNLAYHRDRCGASSLMGRERTKPNGVLLSPHSRQCSAAGPISDIPKGNIVFGLLLVTVVR